MIEKARLYLNFKEFLYVFVFFLCIISLRLGFKYQEYQDFIAKPFFYTYATVLKNYQKSKDKKHYTVIKLHSKNNLTFYISSSPNEVFDNHQLRLQLFPDRNITFRGYLGTFYVKSRIKKRIYLGENLHDRLREQIFKQHSDANISSFYSAIFLATTLNTKMRERVSLLGISHLVALSGFHLGLLWIFVYTVLSFFYKPLMQRYFPYRYLLLDVGFITLLILGYYLYFVHFPISLLRAYAMMIVIWLATLLAIEIINFYLLFTVVLFLLAVFVSLCVSLSFWFSVAGVFYIFLILKQSQNINQWILNIMLMPWGIFILMLPITHTVFAMTSEYQLLSPLLSLGFSLFYPLSILLHFLGYGGVMDSLLLYRFETNPIENFLPLSYLTVYILLSLTAIKYRVMFYLLLAIAMEYGIFLFFF